MSRRIWIGWVVGLAALGVGVGASAAPRPVSVTLVGNGQARCAIVLPAEKNDRIRAAAEDLQWHLQVMSGARVPLVTDTKAAPATKLYLGVTPPGVKLPVALTDRGRFWPDGYLILAGKGYLALLSPRPEGVSNAVYGLLEDYLGCHWFTPGEIGTHIPRRRTVQVSVPGGYAVVRPSFELRAPWYNGNAAARQTPEEQAAMAKWRVRNRAGGIRGYGGQEWSTTFPKELQEKEPGLQAMINGKRAPRGAEGQICISYPRAVEIATERFIHVFGNNPDLDYYTFSPNDNDAWCQCSECEAMGANPAERVLRFTNQVAERVAAACPGKGITLLPYSSTIEPPIRDLKGAQNLYPIICSYAMEQLRPKTDNNPWCNTYRRRVERWMKLLPRAWSYDYIGWYPGPWTLFHNLEADQAYYRRLGFSGLMPEYLDRNLGTDVTMWLTFRIAWDANLKVDALLDQFYPAYFGAAAPTMRALYERFERQMMAVGGTGEPMDVPRLYPVPMVEEALRQIAAAKAQVAGNRVRVARLERDEHCLQLLRRWLDFWDASGRFRRGAASAKQRAQAAAEAYLKQIDSLDGTLTVGKAARAYVASTLEALNDPGTFFAQAGPFRYLDTLDDGGKVYHARSRTGFTISTYGLSLAPGATGELVYEVRAGEGLRFRDAYLHSMYLALPPGGHNQIAVSVDDGQTWETPYQDDHLWGGTAERDLTPLVAGRDRFLLRFQVQNSNTGNEEILAMDQWGIAGTIE